MSAEPALLRALSSSPNVIIREQAAELLSRVGTTAALAALIRALKDPSVFVRHDALWAIEAIVGMRPAVLSCWLNLDINHPTRVHRRVLRWFTVNRSYLSGNELLVARSESAVRASRKRRSTA